MSFKAKLQGLLVFIISAVVIFSAVIFFQFSRYFINGPLYSNIIQGKDLLADILPPPEYIVETHLLTHQLATEQNSEKRERYLKRLKIVESEFFDRKVFWEKNMAEYLKKSSQDEVFTTGEAYFSKVNELFIPALKEPLKAGIVLNETLSPIYELHKVAIDKMVEGVISETKVVEKRTFLEVEGVKAFLIAASAGFAGLMLFILIWFAYRMKLLTKGLINTNDVLNLKSKKMLEDNHELSVRTEKSAASIEEVSATLEEITANLNNTVENSSRASSFMQKIQVLANDGLETSNSTRGAMSEISAGSKKISEIIRLVENIAFQTNILAINAAIEAAKAGEHGKGFAVVAIEVRDLAQRSADAAQEIKGLIETSLSQVKGGEKLVLENNEKLSVVVNNVVEANNLIQEIFKGTKEEHRALEQINIAVSELDGVTQQNAGLVNDIFGATEALANAAEEMSVLVKDNFGKGLEFGIGGITSIMHQFRLVQAQSPTPITSSKWQDRQNEKKEKIVRAIKSKTKGEADQKIEQLLKDDDLKSF